MPDRRSKLHHRFAVGRTALAVSAHAILLATAAIASTESRASDRSSPMVGPWRAAALRSEAPLTRLLMPDFIEAATPREPGRLVIQPMGKGISQADAEFVRHALQVFYGMEVRILTPSRLPSNAWYEPRKRYRAEKLLDYLHWVKPKNAERILGLTAHDISTSTASRADWGMLGLADFSRPVAVVSSFRCFNGARDRLQARVRLAKVAVHEVGHSLGLDHCPNPGCLMEDAQGKIRSDSEYNLCSHCRRGLAQARIAIPRQPVIPWPKPRPAAAQPSR